jgi:glucose/arabinose dehydrogenase
MALGTGRRWAAVLAMALVGATTLVACDLPPDFHRYTVFSGLDQPTNVEFAPDGRVFVAEKRGVVKVFDGTSDVTPTVVADLRAEVFNGWDRGLLGLAIAPDFATDPAVYVLYTLDQLPGGTIPAWGKPGQDVDNCPTPPGYTDDGCVVMGRLSKLPLGADGRWAGQEDVLIDDWCQQYPSHSIGSLAFGPDGSLYVSGGEGASFNFVDYGQDGSPRNPCGDPPAGVGGVEVPATAEGGALRSQDVRTLSDPTTAGGSIIRVDADTGAPVADNPLRSSSNAGARRVVAYGFRNPFRFTVRPGTHELWVGDVGWDEVEEIDRTVGNDATVDNFGWPCYEGSDRMSVWDQADVGMCESLYTQGTGAVTPPAFAYHHRREIVSGEQCDEPAGSAVSGLAFAPTASPYPAAFHGLFFADAIRHCIWHLSLGADGQPDPGTVRVFAEHSGSVVDLQFGPGGELWYADLEGGSIDRIGYSAANHPPAPVVQASPTSGDPPLAVAFDASGSTDPDPGDELTFAWDIDGDGAYDDGTGPTLTHTFTTAGAFTVRVRATDIAGLSETASTTVTVGTPPAPVPVIDTPVDGTLATAGSPLAFSGGATGADGTALPDAALQWQVDLLHCPDACHRHAGVYSESGVSSGSFTVPDHEYPSALELVLTATADGQSASVTRRLDYQATDVTLASQPAGVALSVASVTAVAPFTSPQATGGTVTISAPPAATVGGVAYTLVGWDDGGAASHEVTVPATATTYTAIYQPS